MCHLPMSRKGDAKDVSETSHLEALEAAELAYEDRPAFRTVEQGREHRDLEDTQFGFDGDLFTAVEIRFETPEAFGSLLETVGNLGVEGW